MKHNLFAILLFATLIAVSSCQPDKAASGKLQLTVSIVPQKYVADYIAGDKFDVQIMLPTGSNHETYEPVPRDMEKISSSKLYLALGALDFEITWMDRFKASNPEMKIINTSDGIEMMSGHVHSDNDAGGHDNQGTDPHTWLSPACMKVQAENICLALSSVDSSNALFYKKNLDKFIKLTDSVDKVIREKLAGSEGKSFLIFHPALGYFARDYHLNQISIEQDGKEPSPSYMAELIRISKEKGINSILISKEFDTRNAEAIAREIDGKVVVFDPMAANWPENMIHLANLIAEN